MLNDFDKYVKIDYILSPKYKESKYFLLIK